MALEPNGARPQAVLLYVEEMLVELARMTEQAGRDVLAIRIRMLADEARREAAAVQLRSWLPNPPEEEAPGRPG